MPGFSKLGSFVQGLLTTVARRNPQDAETPNPGPYTEILEKLPSLRLWLHVFRLGLLNGLVGKAVLSWHP